MQYDKLYTSLVLFLLLEKCYFYLRCEKYPMRFRCPS